MLGGPRDAGAGHRLLFTRRRGTAWRTLRSGASLRASRVQPGGRGCGCFTADYPDMQGMSVFGANREDRGVAQAERACCSRHKPYKHSYPYSWRTKQAGDHAGHRAVVHERRQGCGCGRRPWPTCDEVHWIPNWGSDRIYNMLKRTAGLVPVPPARPGASRSPRINDTKHGQVGMLLSRRDRDSLNDLCREARGPTPGTRRPGGGLSPRQHERGAGPL
jgi:hypothetical protein